MSGQPTEAQIAEAKQLLSRSDMPPPTREESVQTAEVLNEARGA